MTVAELLIEARAIVAEPGRWTQRAGARDQAGVRVHPRERGAVMFCAGGAIVRAAYEQFAPFCVAPEAQNILRQLCGEERLAVWNDHRDREHTHVLALYDRAIRAARKMEEVPQ